MYSLARNNWTIRFNVSGIPSGIYEWGCLAYDNKTDSYNTSIANWTLRVITDGNIGPADPTPEINSSDNTSTADLNCYDTFSHPVAKNMNVTVVWYKNDVLNLSIDFNNSYASGTFFNTTLGNGNTSTLDSWLCSMRLFDSVNYSKWVNSTPLIIFSNPPNVTLSNPLSGSRDIDGNVTFICNVTEDQAINNISFYANFSGTWKENQSVVTSDNSSVSFNITNIPIGIYAWNCLAVDNQSQLSWGDTNWTIKINPFLSTPAVGINSSLGTNRTGENLNCFADLSDPDGNNRNVTVLWYKNNDLNLSQDFNNSHPSGTWFNTTLGQGNTTILDSWLCSMRLYDGNSYSLWTNSTPLMIFSNAPNVSLSLPVSGTTDADGNIIFVCNITEDQSIDNISLYANLSGTWQVNKTFNFGHNGVLIDTGSIGGNSYAVAFADLDNDNKKNDLVVSRVNSTTELSLIRAYYPNGSIRWNHTSSVQGSGATLAIRVEDIDNDLYDDDIVASFYSSSSYDDVNGFRVFNQSGRAMSNRTILPNLATIDLGDLNNDGVYEIIYAGHVNPDAYILEAFETANNGLSWTTKWNQSNSSGDIVEVSSIDAFGDGIKDEVFLAEYQRFYCLNGTNGSIIWNTSYFYYPQSFTAIDLDNDGYEDEIVHAANYWDTYQLYARHARNGSIIWNINVGATSAYDRMFETVAADLDGDGYRDDIVVSDRHIYGVLANSTIIWNFTNSTGYIYSIKVGDLDNDGKDEIAAGGATDTLYVLNRSGNLLWSKNPGRGDIGQEYGKGESLAIGDINDDGINDIAVATVEGHVFVYTNNPQNKTLSFNITGILPGNYIWNCLAIDNQSQSDWGDTNWTIKINSLPANPSVAINSSLGTNRTGENLNCFSALSDPDGNNLNVTVLWYKNNALNLSQDFNNSYPSGSWFNATLGSANTTLLDSWKCSMRLFDSLGYSSWVNSTPLIIFSVPTVNLTSPGNAAIDADGFVQFMCEASSGSGITNVSLWTNFSGSWRINKTVNFGRSGFHWKTADLGEAYTVEKADLDHTGVRDDIVFGAYDSGSGLMTIQAYWANGSKRWDHTPTNVDDSAIFSSDVVDADGDGYIDDYLLLYNNHFFFKIYNNTGEMYSNSTPLKDYISTIGEGDVDGNGIIDKVYYGSAEIPPALLSAFNVSTDRTNWTFLWNITLNDGPKEIVGMDSDSDNLTDEVAVATSYEVYMLEAQTGNVNWSYNRSEQAGYFQSQALTPIDLDNDGYQDELIFTAGYSVDKQLSAVHAKNGSYIWNTTLSMSASYAYNHEVLPIDLDGDGLRDDVVVSDRYVHGVLGNSTVIWIFDPGAGDTYSMAVGDLDGDGNDDILAAQDSRIYVLNRTGNLTFSTDINDDTIGSAYGGRGEPLAIADFNGDGYNDFAVASTGGTVRMYSLAKNDWTIRFNVSGIPVGHYAWNCLGGDNLSQTDWGDTNWTIKINSLPTNPSVAINSSLGTNRTGENLNCFSTISDADQNNLNVTVLWYKNNALNLSLDFNNSYLSWTWFNATLGQGNTTILDSWLCSMRLFDSLGYSSWVNSTPLIIFSNPPNVSLSLPISGSTVANGNVTFICNVTEDQTINNISLYANFSGTWRVNKSYNFGNNGILLNTSDLGVSYSVKFADMDHDRKLNDLVLSAYDSSTSNTMVRSYYNNNSIRWESIAPLGAIIYAMRVGDFDNDSYFDDVAVVPETAYGNNLFVSNSSGNMIADASPSGYWSILLDIGDTNNDSRIDFVIEGGYEEIVAYNTSNWTYWTHAWNKSLSETPYQIKIFDADGDGYKNEIFYTDGYNVICAHAKNNSQLWNHTDSEFQDFRPYCFTVIDLDNDGNEDEVIFCANCASSRSDIYAVHGINGSIIWDTNLSCQDASQYEIVPADLDSDGYRDDVVVSEFDIHGVLGNSTVIWTFTNPTDSTYNIAAGDLNNDGKDEIVAGGADDTLYVLNRTGGLLWSKNLGQGDIGRGRSQSEAIAIADANDDGYNDIAVATVGGFVYLYSLPMQNSSVSFNITNIPIGHYIWNCLAIDNQSQSGWGDTNWTIKINSLPTNPSVAINSSLGTNKTGESLNCFAAISDPDQNNLNVTVLWYKNNALNRSMDFNNSYLSGIWFNTTLGQGNTTILDSWLCSMRLFDSLGYSSWVNSTPLIIFSVPTVNLTSPNNAATDADGFVQFMCEASSGSGITNVSLWTNFSGTWRINKTVNFGRSGFHWKTADFGDAYSVEKADLDHTGVRDDIVFGEYKDSSGIMTIQALWGNGSKRWDHTPTDVDESSIWASDVVDADGDGYIDDFLLLYNGLNLFKIYNSSGEMYSNSTPLNDYVSLIGEGDVDGNGIIDMVYVGNQYLEKPFLWAFNVSFDRKNWTVLWNFTSTEPPREIVGMDSDSDNLTDEVAVATSYEVYMLEGKTGKLNWSYNRTTHIPALYPEALTPIDLDNDGYQDELIFTGGYYPDKQLSAVHARNGSYIWNTTFSMDVTYAYNHEVLPIDLDGDGFRDDVVVSDRYVHGVLGNSTVIWRFDPGVGDTFSLAVGDLDGDGNDDILAAQGSSIYVLNRTGNLTFSTDINDGTIGTQYGGKSEPLTIADFNGDGYNDFAIASTGGTIRMYSLARNDWTIRFNVSGIPVGHYAWNCLAIDNQSQSDWGDANWTIRINSNPVNPSVAINSSLGTNRTGENLNCFSALSDPDVNNLNVTVLWYKNNILNLSVDFNNSYSSGTFFNATLGNANTTKGDYWICSMRLFDGFNYGLWANSSNLTILNTPPTTPSTQINSSDGSASTLKNLNCYSTLNDPDEDNLNVSVQWYKDGVLNLTIDYNNSYTSGTFFNSSLDYRNLTLGSSWLCSMNLFDSQNYSSWANSSSIIISSTGISSCYNITQGGLYTLTENIVNFGATCITINASNVSFNCYSHWIDGTDAGSSYGIYIKGTTTRHIANITVRNCFINDFDTALYSYYVNYSVFSNLSINSTSSYGFSLSYSNFNNLSNAIITSSSLYGYYIYYSNDNYLSNLSSISNSRYGIYLYSSNRNRFNDIISVNQTNAGYGHGIYLDWLNTYNNFSNGTISGNRYGIYTSTMNQNANNIFTGFNITNNSINGLYIGGSADDNNLIYNNYFNNTNNSYHVSGADNIWDNGKVLSRNIIGGSYLGGNYWSNYRGPDSDNDGIGDIGYDMGDNEIDNYPLVDSSNIDNVTMCGPITMSGVYYLKNNITGFSGTCFTINTSNVTFDCQSNWIDGTDVASSYGIYIKGTPTRRITNITVRNCFINDFDTGLYSYYVNYSVFSNLSINSTSSYGFSFSYSNFNNLSNAIITSSTLYGYYIYYSNDNYLSNLSSISNSRYGFYLDASNRNRFNNITSINNTAASYGHGIYLSLANTYNNFTGGTISGNRYGIYTSNMNQNANNLFTGFNITNNSINGIYFGGSADDNNLIYNNYFNNTNNSYHVSSADNIWNTGKVSSTNIIGGSNLGGNYWSSYRGPDADNDGIGDISYDMGDSEIDNYPLVDSSNLDNVTNCGQIFTSGVYYLKNNITDYSGTCFTINTSNVTFDCQSNWIDGTDAGSSYGIYITGTSARHITNITIRNCFINDFETGLYSSYVNNSVFSNLSINSSTWYGISFSYSNFNNLSNTIITSSSLYGYYIYYSNNNYLSNLSSISNSRHGFYLYNSIRNRYNDITSLNHTAASYGYGIYFYSSNTYNNFTNGTLSGNRYGIYSYDSLGGNTNNILTGFNITNNSINGIYISGSADDNNLIYNNYFNNTNNSYHVSGADNIWDNGKVSSTNIIGGSYLGGNYWSNFRGPDADNDGIGDIGYDMGDNEIDYYPLVDSSNIDNVTMCGPISTPGVYYLKNNITGFSWTCFAINTSNVTFDCQSNWIDGADASSSNGIYITGTTTRHITNVTIRNCFINDFETGLYSYYVNNSVFSNLSINSSTLYGVFFSSSNFNNLSNAIITSSSLYGYHLSSSHNNYLSNLSSISNSRHGFYIDSSNRNRFNDITSLNHTAASYGYGIYLYSSNTYNNFTNGTLGGNRYGIYTYDGFGGNTNNIFTGLNITNNSINGIYISGSADRYNLIYNNYFNNSKNVFHHASADNYWNTSKTAGTNIVGGPWIGGNYWANTSNNGFSQSCTDADRDGLCDSAYDMENGEIDNFPLTKSYNYIPATPSLQINSSNSTNKTTEDLNCFSTISDPDSNNLNVTIKWYRNNTLNLTIDFNSSYSSGTFFNSVLGNANTTKGDSWICSMRLFDSFNYSLWANSSNLTILNTPPTTPAPTINSTDGTNLTTQNLNCFDTLLDADNDTINASVRWYRNNILNLTIDFNNSYSSGTFFNAILGSGNLTIGDTWLCSMRLYDNQNYSSWGNSTSLTIATPSIEISLVYPTTNINAIQNRFFNVTVNVSCYKANCGEINVSLDPTSNSIYDYSDTTNNKAYYGGTTSSRTPNLPNSTSWIEYNSTHYQNIITNDASLNHWAGSVGSSTLYYQLLYNFTINEEYVSINNISFKWAGQQFSPGLTNITIFIYNYSSKNWVEIFTVYSFQSFDVNITVNITGGFSDFINNSKIIFSMTGGKGSPGGPVSLLPGTKVLMHNNSYKNIEELKPDELVSSYDVATNNRTIGKISAFYEFDPNEDYYIIINDKLRAMSDHKVYTEQGFKYVKDLILGDYLLDENESWVKINSLEKINERPINVYDITVEKDHTYFAEGYLVHNTDGYLRDNFVQLNVTSASSKGLITSSTGATPFYTNESNPRNITLNKDQSQLVTFWVNATGTIGNNYTFFAYANLTSVMNISNITSEFNVTITAVPNTPPTNPSPAINSTDGTNLTTQNLNCFDTILDDDNNTLNVSVQWYRNIILNLTIDFNNSYPNGSFFNAVLGSENTTAGDNWTCSMRLYDTIAYSGWGNSTTLTILNSVPSAVILIEPTNGNDFLLNRTPTFIWNASTDADNDNLSYQIEVNCPACVAEINVTSVNGTNWTAQSPLDLDKVYFWRVRAYDGTEYGGWSAEWNFTILSTSIIVINGSIDFGNLLPNAVENTTDDNPYPLTVENNGNVDVNVSVYAQNSLWAQTYAGLGTEYVRIMAGNSSEANSFNWALSVTTWTDITNITNKVEVFKYLNYSDSNDFAELEIKVTIPEYEPPGNKNMTIVFEAKAT